LPLNLRSTVTRREPRWWQPGLWHGVAAAAAMALVGIMLFYFTDPIIATAVGEQRVVTLEDGTRLSLNTATKLRVQFTPQVRRVQLLAGEALFEVAKRPSWPFVVEVDNRTVTALGTAFVIRREAERVAITLVEGRIAIDDLDREVKSQLARMAQSSITSATLLPGERMTYAADQTPKKDHPPLDSVVAWQRGQAIFDNVRLADAVAEMNRYNDVVPLAIADAAAADLPVSGIFRLGDSVSFARAVAFNYGLRLSEDRTRIVLTSATDNEPSLE